MISPAVYGKRRVVEEKCPVANEFSTHSTDVPAAVQAGQKAHFEKERHSELLTRSQSHMVLSAELDN